MFFPHLGRSLQADPSWSHLQVVSPECCWPSGLGGWGEMGVRGRGEKEKGVMKGGNKGER